MFHTLLSKSQIFLVDLAEALLVIHTNRFCVKFFVKKGNLKNNFQTLETMKICMRFQICTMTPDAKL